MLFDIHLERMIEDKEIVVRGLGNKILDLDFLKKYKMIQPASLDIRLNTVFAIHKANYKYFDLCREGKCFDSIEISSNPIDPINLTPDDYEIIKTEIGSPFIIPPLGFCLAGTIESIQAPDNICYQLDGKSTIGRLGLSTHVTAGFADPGFINQITLEIFNHNYFPIIVRSGMFIGQYKFFRSFDGIESQNPYRNSGTYVDQPATQPPKTEKLYRWIDDENKIVA